MIIDGKPIGTKFKPYIIAELSANHGGSIESEGRPRRGISRSRRPGGRHWPVLPPSYPKARSVRRTASTDQRQQQTSLPGRSHHRLQDSDEQ